MRWAAWCALWLVAGPLLAQERAPLISTVDLSVPVAPVAVTIGGRPVVVHELHVTNFQNVAVALARIQVRAGDDNAVIADFAGESLTARLGRPGLTRPVADAHVVAPGMRAVVYFWIELPAGATPPSDVRHNVELDVRRTSGSVRTVVTGAPAALVQAAPVVLDPPLRGGPWAAIYDPLLMGGHRTAFYTVDGRASIPGRFAIDWIRVPPANTVVARATASQAPDWNGYGEEVLAVADATVVAAMDDIAENPEPPSVAPMPPENASGNYVTLDLGGGRFAFYEHLRRGSLTVRRGDRVTRGQVIGRLGNSGSSSIGPRLHFHVADANATLGADGVPFVFRQFDVLGAFPSITSAASGGAWQAARQTRVRLEAPAPNVVVTFP